MIISLCLLVKATCLAENQQEMILETGVHRAKDEDLHDLTIMVATIYIYIKKMAWTKYGFHLATNECNQQDCQLAHWQYDLAMENSTCADDS